MFTDFEFYEKTPNELKELGFHCRRESDNQWFHFEFSKEEGKWELDDYVPVNRVGDYFEKMDNIKLTNKEIKEYEHYFLSKCKYTRLRFVTN